MKYRLVIMAWIIARKKRGYKQILLMLSQVFFCNADNKQ